MWAFNEFPAKLERKALYPDGPSYEVEVFGYLNKILVIYRVISYWIKNHDDIDNIEFLPIHEFEERFKEFKLVET